jgi:hypothetical protein
MKIIIVILFIILVLVICYICNIYTKHNILNQKYGGSRSFTDIFTNDLKTFNYTISGEYNGLIFKALRDILNESDLGVKFVEKPVTEKVHISFGTFHSQDQSSSAANYDPLFEKQKASIKNVLGGHSAICDKTILFKTIKNLIPMGDKYIPKTNTVANFDPKEIKKDDLFILKKKDAARQMGVLVFKTKEEYEQAKTKLNINPSNGIISKYITNPLTVNGKKMHLRIYILLSIQSGITRCYVFDEYKIYIAEQEYKKDDWLNPKIHISGAESTKKRYNWPQDIDQFKSNPKSNPKLGSKLGSNDIIPSDLIDNLNECLKTLCMGMALSNIKNYEESDAGYHIYGADILLTDDNKSYILEVNKRPGFGWVAKDPEDGFPYEYSYRYFMFILNATIFPHFGLKRQLVPMAEVIGNGVLTPFAKLLTGMHRNYLIPLLDATRDELQEVKSIHFYNPKLLFSYLMEKEKNEKYIYLIANKNTIIGYLIVLNRWIHIAIIKEFQHRGIATAMIAQFMEIYLAIFFTDKNNNPTLYIGNSLQKQFTNFILKIAEKLNFSDRKSYFERACRIKDPIMVKINKHKLLTYNNMTMYNDNGFNTSSLLDKINKHMVKINTQFVHLVYGIVDKKYFLSIALSTGSRFQNDFISQGAELKSALQIPNKFINSIYLLCQYIKKNKMTQYYYFLGIEDLGESENENHHNENHHNENHHNDEAVQIFEVFTESNHYAFNKADRLKIIEEIDQRKKNEINKLKELGADLDINESKSNYEIKKYHSPFLLEGKKMILKLFVVLYISGNGVKKCYIFDKYIICTALKPYTVEKKSNWNDNDIHRCVMITTDKIYSLPEKLKHINLKKIYNSIADMFVNSEYKPYPESNSGFVEFTVDLLFVNIGNKYEPIINNLNNTIQLWKFLNMPDREYKKFVDDFSTHYYHWITHKIIFPHFGITMQHKPNAIAIANKLISANILASLSLQFEDKSSVDIHLDGNNIGNIKLNLAHLIDNIIILDHIEIKSEYRKKELSTHSIFLLMDILGAKYAPDNPILKFKYVKQMFNIAYKLEFQKINDHFIKTCRI